MVNNLKVLLFLILGSVSTDLSASNLGAVFPTTLVAQDTTIAPVPERGEKASKVAITAAGIAVGTTLLYLMFVAVQAYWGLIVLAGLAIFVAYILGITALLLSRRKTKARKRGAVAFLISVIMVCVWGWQGGKALDHQ